jgi:hypothetical protein
MLLLPASPSVYWLHSKSWRAEHFNDSKAQEVVVNFLLAKNAAAASVSSFLLVKLCPSIRLRCRMGAEITLR